MPLRATDPSAATVELVRERDAHRCARCAGWGPLSTQHRVARGMGGSRRWAGINRPGNLLTLCGDGVRMCHGWVEDHPAWAERHGWSVRRRGLLEPNPQLVPVWTWRGWVLLLDGGELEPLPQHPGVDGCACGCRPRVPTPGLWDSPDLDD